MENNSPGQRNPEKLRVGIVFADTVTFNPKLIKREKEGQSPKGRGR